VSSALVVAPFGGVLLLRLKLCTQNANVGLWLGSLGGGCLGRCGVRPFEAGHVYFACWLLVCDEHTFAYAFVQFYRSPPFRCEAGVKFFVRV